MVISQSKNNHVENNRYEIWLIIGLLIIGLGLRLFRLSYWSIWIEEDHLMRDVQIYMETFSAIYNNPRPIFYLIVLPFFSSFGAELGVARAVSSVIGVASIPLLYLFTKRALGRPIALIATFLFVFAPWHIFWSQNARFYTLLLIFYSLSYIYFYLTIETDRLLYNILAIGFLGAATLTHSIGVMLWPIFIIHYLTVKYAPGENPPGLKFKNLLPYFVLPIVGYILLEVLRVAVIGTNFLIVDLYIKFFDSSTASFIGYESPLIMLTTVVYSIGYPLFILSIYGAFDLMFAVRDRLSFLLLYGAFLPLAFMVLIAFVSGSTTNRYVFMTLPFWVVLAASGVWRLIERRNSVIGVLLIIVIISAFFVDPHISDIFHYVGISNLYLIFLVLLIAGFVALLIYQFPTDHFAYPGYLLLFILCFHALSADVLYYGFQHGYRDNWIGPIEAIQSSEAADEIVLTHPYPVVEFYLEDQQVESIDAFRDNPDMYDGQTVWVIEEFGSELYLPTAYPEWIANNRCEEVGDWSQYVAGRSWPMILYQCNP